MKWVVVLYFAAIAAQQACSARLEKDSSESEETMVFGRNQKLLGSEEGSTEVTSFGSNKGRGSTDVTSFGSKSAAKETITVPAPDDDSKPSKSRGSGKETITVPAPDDDTKPSKSKRSGKETITVPAPDDSTNETITVPAPDDDTKPSKPKRSDKETITVPAPDDTTKQSKRSGDKTNKNPPVETVAPSKSKSGKKPSKPVDLEKETITVPEEKDETKESSSEETVAPGKPGIKPPVSKPANALKLRGVKDAKETDFLAKLEPIKKATQKLQKKSVPGQKKLGSGMKKIEDRTTKAIDKRLKVALRTITKSKKIPDDKRAEYKRDVEKAVTTAKSEITTYMAKMNERVPKLMKMIDNSKLYEEIDKLLEKYSTKQTEAAKELSTMTTTVQDGINSRFADAEAVISRIIN